jgi:hypothetical protein
MIADLGDTGLAAMVALPLFPSWSNGDIEDISPSVQAPSANTATHAGAHISARRLDSLKV